MPFITKFVTLHTEVALSFSQPRSVEVQFSIAVVQLIESNKIFIVSLLLL